MMKRIVMYRRGGCNGEIGAYIMRSFVICIVHSEDCDCDGIKGT